MIYSNMLSVFDGFFLPNNEVIVHVERLKHQINACISGFRRVEGSNFCGVRGSRAILAITDADTIVAHAAVEWINIGSMFIHFVPPQLADITYHTRTTSKMLLLGERPFV